MTKTALLASTAVPPSAASEPKPSAAEQEARAAAQRQRAPRPAAPRRRAQRRRQIRSARRDAGEEGDGDGMEPDSLVPDPKVWKEFGICSMTLFRWTNDPELGFPQPIKINGRCYRIRRELEEFKQRMLRRAIAERARERELA
jgi:hypothetical protein